MSISRHTPTSPDDLASIVSRADTVRVNAATCDNGQGQWRLRMLEIVIGGGRDGSAATRRWVYPAVDLVSFDAPGESVAGWLRERRVALPERAAEHDAFMEPLYWERRESFAQTGYKVVDWPTDEARLISNLQANEPAVPLISAEDAPSFASFYNAAASFFGLGTKTVGRSLPTSGVFRWIDTRARINRVNIDDDEVRVEVEGDSLDGLIVELAGDTPGTAITMPESTDNIRTVTFPVTDGLPTGAWVVVRSGAEWLDRRFLSRPSGFVEEPGVNVEITPKARLDGYIAGRENDTVEFKREIPASEDSKARVMKTVCAFANGAGGSLLFGINDEYEIVGLPATKANRYIDQLSELVDAWVEPSPTCSFDVLQIDDASTVVIELVVSPGAALHGSSKPNEPRKVYVRHHSRSVPARVREIEDIVRNRTAAYRFPQ
ncbi:ATP-binding protein [Microbacterium capsulatum]|uniref:ATP-binding protein n=1 Tax=Microbacterium capsulatum TaxID=3041921 RepID=A0ABU0XJH7_9MICO|nr:ATP-binding protein [Microbacterium sp. ASV81]MDQ4214743.1 ATP-binding protein [Microbacterium sp. ASV81]